MTRARFLSNPGVDDLPRSAEVIVIGGGPAGAGALWALDRAAPGIQTVLIEKNEQLAAGANTASLENFRTCWPIPCQMRLMTRSIEVFQQADDLLGEGAGESLAVRQQGYVFCGTTAAQADVLKREVEHLHSIGLGHVEYLDADEVRYRFPWLASRVIAAKYDPVAGWLDSYALTYRLAQNASGATVLLDVPEVCIAVEGGRVVGVDTPNGRIAAPNVIIAAGAGARAVGRTAGIELPIEVRPRQSITTSFRHEAFAASSPCIIGAPPFPHVRPEAQNGAIFGWEYHWNDKQVRADAGPPRGALVDPIWPVSRLKDPRFPMLVLALLARQFGHRDGEGFADPRYLRGLDHRAGYYVYRDGTNAYTIEADGTRRPYESQRAILDAWPGIDGLFLSVAHVGHGIMSAPAAGEVIAARVLGRPLPDPAYADFGLDVHWVEGDAGGLSAGEP